MNDTTRMDDMIQDETPQPRHGHPDGRFADPVTGDNAGPPPEDTFDTASLPGNAPMVPVQALMDERRKRREAEHRLHMQSAHPMVGTQQFTPTNPLADTPLAADPSTADLAAADLAAADPQDTLGLSVANPNGSAGRDVAETVSYLNDTETVARSRYRDFDRVVDVFEQAAAGLPALIHEMTASSNPAEYAYRAGIELMAGTPGPATGYDPAGLIGQRSDTAAFEAHIRADERARLLSARHHTGLTQSLSGEQSASPTGDEIGWQPKSLKEILGA